MTVAVHEKRCLGCGEFDTPERDPLCYVNFDPRYGHVDVDVDENGIAIVEPAPAPRPTP